MDIHPPSGPVSSVKEFGVHIAIVTVGILIALSLEGLIETVHDRHLAAEARADIRAELLADQKFAHAELNRQREIAPALEQFTAELPAPLRAHPEQLGPRLAAVRNSGYFLPTETWEAVLSTGALAHVPTGEVERYADVFYIIREYAQIEKVGDTADDHVQVFFRSRAAAGESKLSTPEIAEAAERIANYAQVQHEMLQVCEQMVEDIDQVLASGEGKGRPEAK